MISFDLKHKIALVTGASRGIGRAIAETFAAYGAEVVVVSRKIDALKETADAILKNGGKARAIACNMGDMAGIAALYDEIQKTHGRLGQNL